MAQNVDLEHIAGEIRRSKKYAALSHETVLRVVEWAAARFQKAKDIDENSRKKLHQVYGAYLGAQDKALLKALQQLPPDAPLAPACMQLLGYHSSTRERAPFIAEYYRKIQARVGTPARIIDIGCGLNPLSYPWMAEAFGAVQYIGYDIDMATTAAMHAFFQARQLPAGVRHNDVFLEMPEHTEADLLLFLKVLPCFEQQEKEIGRRLLEAVKSRTFVVSFPSLSLGGKNKGMRENYRQYLEGILPASEYDLECISFPNEDVYIIKRKS